MFLCPECEEVFDYTEDDVKHDVFAVPDHYLPQGEPRLVCLDFVCGNESCGILVKIRSILEPEETRESFEAKTRKAIANVRCPGHHTVMPDDFDFPPYSGSACEML